MSKKNTRIDQTLKNLASATPIGKTEPAAPEQPAAAYLAGDPDCPYCHGLGYLRRDLPVTDPEFGRLQICICRQGQVAERVHQRLFAMSNLDSLAHLTFDNFQPRGQIGLGPREADSLETAFNHCRQYAQNLKGWLLLQGGYGCGKTHLAAAIGNFAVSIGVPTLFVTVPDLLDMLRFAYDDPTTTFEKRFDEIRASPLLILDDFGTHNATNWAQEKLFQIINHRYINRLPLVVTTNLTLAQIEGRILSRLKDPEMVSKLNILAPDYRKPGDDTSRSVLSSLDLYRQQTFVTWDDRHAERLAPADQASLQRALQAAMEFARSPNGWLVFTGPYGCGKTHLAAAIANARNNEKLFPPLFINVPDLLDHLRATFSANSDITLDRRFEEVRTAPLLILDDLGAQYMTPWVKEKLYQLFNYRYITRSPTVITTASFTDEMDSRIFSRLKDERLSAIIAITAPAYRGSGGATLKPRKPRKKSS